MKFLNIKKAMTIIEVVAFMVVAMVILLGLSSGIFEAGKRVGEAEAKST